MTSVNTNAAALLALQNLNRTSERLEFTQNRVSTGLKVQGARDNAAVWAVAQNQRADVKTLESVTHSLNRAISVADTALSAGESISDLLVDMRQKAVAAADPAATTATRTAYDNELQALLTSLQTFTDNASFDGKNLLDNSETADLQFLANVDASDTIILSPQNFTRTGLGINTINLTSQANASAALTAIETALNTVTAGLAELGSQTKQIEAHVVFVSKLSDSLETGVGKLVDADMAKEAARLQALQVQQQLGTQSLSIANQAPQIILSLFRN